jgi:hypothetical protein
MTQQTSSVVAPQVSQQTIRQASMLLRLYQLADAEVTKNICEVSRFMPMTDSMLGGDLYKLATEVTLRCLILQKELLHVFCEPAAAALLMRLPNRYWFWSAIKGAIMQVDDEGMAKPLTQEQVALALAEIRRGYTAKYNLRTSLAELNQAQVASRTAAGVILVRSCFGELDEVVFNPIFAPCPGTDGTFAQSAAALTASLLKA